MLTNKLDSLGHMQKINALKRGRTNGQTPEPCLVLKLPSCYLAGLHTCNGKRPEWRICDTHGGLLVFLLVETTFNPQLSDSYRYGRSDR